jgi:hypothetical protein
MSTKANGKRHHDEILISALAAGASYAEAARVVRTSKATVARRMAEPAFRARVVEEREQAVDRVRGVLAGAAPAAARSLLELAEEATSESVRLTAAFRVLELALRRRAGFDLFSEQEVITFTRQLVEVALPRIPAEQQEGFLLEVRALGSR